MRPRHAWVAAALAAAVALLDAPSSRPARAQTVTSDVAQRLEQANEAFRFQNFERTIQLLEPLVDDARIQDPRMRLTILERLGASQWFLGLYGSARRTFTALLRIEPNYPLDKLYYPPELVRFFDEHRQFLKDEGVIGRPPDVPPDPDNGPPAGRLVRTVTLRRAPLIAYFAPFGVGQFANDDRTTGTVVAVLQGIGLAVNVASYFGLQANLIPGTNQVSDRDQGQASLLEGLWWGGTAVFVGAWGYSIVDGLTNRPPARSVEERLEPFESPDEVPRELPAPGVTLRLMPGPGDLGLGVGATF